MIKSIIDYSDRANPRSQIMISLFGCCNMKCDFCFQRKQKYSTTKNEFKNFQKILNLINAVVDSEQWTNSVSVSIIGGELFQSNFSVEYYKNLIDFINNVRDIFTSKNVKCVVGVTTNAMTVNDMVLDTLQHVDKVCVSYDFVGRFKSYTQNNTWFGNVDIIKNNTSHNPTVEIIAHKPNIDIIMSNHPQWVGLYQNNLIEFNFLENGKNTLWEVNEKILSDFFIFLHTHYPLVSNIQYLVGRYYHQFNNNRTCTHGIVITPHGCIADCCDRNKHFSETIASKRCLSCKHMLYCGHTCYREFYSNTDCYIKNFFNHYENWLSRPQSRSNNSR